MDNQPKISTPEAFILVIFALFTDALNWIPVFGWLVNFFSLIGFTLYFIMKGVDWRATSWSVGGNILDSLISVMFLGFLPVVTAGILAAIIVDRVTASKLGQTALKAAGPAGKLVGK